ncbi:hypothetical protein GCM10027291_41190 [Telluribacter humicola]
MRVLFRIEELLIDSRGIWLLYTIIRQSRVSNGYLFVITIFVMSNLRNVTGKSYYVNISEK